MAGDSCNSFAKRLTESSAIGYTEVGHPTIHMVPLEKRPVAKKEMYCSYDFGKPSYQYKTHKVIMLVGATGTGKSTLINAMINYILGVKWEDDFRFKLVNEHGTGELSQAHSQTQITSSYTIHMNKHHQIPYNLTIIDTPGFGDTRGIERDKTIIEQIREFYSHPKDHGVDHIDAVGFVVQASQARLTPTQNYIFDSTLSIFGKDVGPNIIVLVTFCDGSDPIALDAIKEANIPHNERTFEFNNAALFAKKGKRARLASYWEEGMKETKRFLQTVSELEAKSLTLSKEVLERRYRLEQKIQGLQSQWDICSAKERELEKEKEELERCQREVHAYKSFRFESSVIEDEKISSDVGVLNCDKCQFTCHYPCSRSDKQKKKCYMMKKGMCRVCPGRCSWNVHLIQSYRHVYKERKKTKTFTDIERRCRDAKGKQLSVEEVIVKLKADIEEVKQSNAGLLLEIYQELQRLEDIALRPHPVGFDEYIDLLIDRERDEAKIGWQARVKVLESYKGQQSLRDSLKSGISKTWNWIVRKIKTD